MAILTFVARLFQPAGASFLNMQLGDFAQYVLLFGAGILTARRGWLMALPLRSGLRWLLVTLIAGFPFWLVIVLAGGALEGNAQAYSGGWRWQSAALDLWQSLTCVGVCFGLLVLFRENFNRQPPLARFLSANAFAVYVFHPPVVIMAARLLAGSSRNCGCSKMSHEYLRLPMNAKGSGSFVLHCK